MIGTVCSVCDKHQAWELATDPPISVGKKKCPPKKMKRSAQIRMQWFYTKLKTGRCKAVLCSFYVLFLLKSFRGLRPLTPTRGIAPWTPTGGLLRAPGPRFSADFSIRNSHACNILLHSVTPSGTVSMACLLYCFITELSQACTIESCRRLSYGCHTQTDQTTVQK